jgi:protein-S-isoprenylcysteine O-methyltransferase Ste14
MTSPPSALRQPVRSVWDKRLLAALAAIVALIIVGLYQLEQIEASIYAYLGGSVSENGAGPVPQGYWIIAIVNILLVAMFLALTPVRLKQSWKAHGAYMGFMISLFSEMYGFPLTIYLLSSATYPTSPLFGRYVWGFGHLIGSPVVIAGILLIYRGWKEIVFRSGNVLVTDGIYSAVRHPQYLGFMLVTLGQFLVWPTIPTAILWPLLAYLYYRQARREESALSGQFGEKFQEYAGKTPMFLPRIRIRRKPKPVSP